MVQIDQFNLVDQIHARKSHRTGLVHINFLRICGRCGRRIRIGTRRSLPVRQFSNQLIQAGAKIAPGSDAGWRSYPLGHFQKELIALCDLDISTMQAIVSGTKESAKSIGVGNSVGTLESGKQADVLVTAGNPLETLDALSSVEAVFKDGVHVK